ncbi:ribosome-binding factor A [Anoxynatronum buryatiense]|uniref:Ribosome-binding factor A n=1 Tax=Anoxynatronum buryatiense TaxID=489973 RepID=A0AA45WUL3_9CLOT|nr:30S ribosome-binding factor RbfA [Anoxynatronum buryatiense]SMP47646.1 ribosome-binding factor A [Anoxynatronum buryatiense]
MAYPRVSRINEEYKKIISQIIRHELKDPRISQMASVVSVDVTRDLSFATVYISVLGSEDEKQQTLEGLAKSAGYVRREVGKRVKLHHTPAILFKEDNSIEYGVSMSQKIAAVNRTDADHFKKQMAENQPEKPVTDEDHRSDTHEKDSE